MANYGDANERQASSIQGCDRTVSIDAHLATNVVGDGEKRVREQSVPGG
jgi:hypothetical protein